MPQQGRGITEYLAVVRARWRVAICVVAVVVGGAAAYAFTATPQYRAAVQLFVATQPSASQDTQALYDGGQFTEGRVLSYVTLVSSRSVTAPVIRKLHLHLSSSKLAGELSAVVPTNTVLLNIDATNPNPKTAQRIASAVGQQLIAFINQLEKPRRGFSPVKVSVSDPATVPSSPVSPDKKLILGIALILGLGLAMAASLAREALDNTIRSRDQLVDAGYGPVLSVLPKTGPTSMRDRSRGARARAASYDEAVRQLRACLQFVDVDHPVDSVVVTSALPGEGKSTIALALAKFVADVDREVILVDGDLRRPAIALRTGSHSGIGLTDLLAGHRSIDEVLTAQSAPGKLRIIPAGTPVPNPGEILASARLRQLIQQLKQRADLVVIDTPPLLPVSDATVLATETSGVLLVVEIGRITTHELEAALSRLRAVNARILGLVGNKETQVRASYSYDYGRAAAAVAGSGEGL